MKNSTIITALKLNLFLKLKNLYFIQYNCRIILYKHDYKNKIINKSELNNNIKLAKIYLNEDLNKLNKNKYNTHYLINNYLDTLIINDAYLKEAVIY